MVISNRLGNRAQAMPSRSRRRASRCVFHDEDSELATVPVFDSHNLRNPLARNKKGQMAGRKSGQKRP
jgi:hypothetical protein